MMRRSSSAAFSTRSPNASPSLASSRLRTSRAATATPSSPHRRQMLKRLKHARLDHTYEPALRKLLAVDLPLLDDFGLDALDATECRDTYWGRISLDNGDRVVAASKISSRARST